MIYLSGAVHPAIVGNPRLGYMLTPMMHNRAEHTAQTWGADTGCFAKPHLHSDENYLRWLASRNATTNLFATAPDVVGDARATLERSAPMLPRIRAAGYRAALVAQDGIEQLTIDWPSFDCLFLGGSTDWKLSSAAETIAREAKARGKWVHMGRVNSAKRMLLAARWGCDSTDGTFLAFGPEKNLIRLQQWFDRLDAQAA